MVEIALVLVIVALVVSRYFADEGARKERDRLVRLAFSDSKPERIAALLPDKPSSSVSKANTDRPGKPEGI